MGRRKKEESAVVADNRPLRKCYDCLYWHMHKDGSDSDGIVDFSTGSCDKNGYSKVPPLFTCPAWYNYMYDLSQKTPF